MPWVLPLLHPTVVQRGQWNQRSAQVTYLERAVRLLKGDVDPGIAVDVNQPPPGTKLRPTLATLQWFDAQLPEWEWLSVDLESAGKFIILAGLTAYRLTPSVVIGPTLSLPFRQRHGLNYWPTWDDHVAATGYLWKWLADPALGKCFHNGVAFDVPLLEEHGFEVNGDLDDTMIGFYYSYSEMRRGLQYLATLMLGIPVWKTLVDADDDAEGKS